MLAIRRTTVTLVAGNLEKDGVIICGRGYMQIVSRDALQRRSCECYGRVKGYVERLHAAHQQEIVARSEFSKPKQCLSKLVDPQARPSRQTSVCLDRLRPFPRFVAPISAPPIAKVAFQGLAS